MNLATRCTDCGTAFRVVPDQLKVSEGWVRCGRCDAVFNAQEQLFDLDAPVAAAAAGTGNDDVIVAARLPPAGSSPGHPPRAEPADGLQVPATPAPPAETEPGQRESGQADFAPGIDPSPAPMADSSPGVIVSIGDAGDGAAQEPPVRIDADEAQVTPSFMRTGSSDPQPSRRWVHAATAALAALLAVALALQLAMAWRSELAARSPGLRAALGTVCDLAGCTVDAPRRIDDLSVDASGLVRIEGASLHRLTVTLRNRAETRVLPPAIELALTDAQGALVARRVLGMGDFGLALQAIEPGTEVPLQALLGTGDRRISGYTVEVFYP